MSSPAAMLGLVCLGALFGTQPAGAEGSPGIASSPWRVGHRCAESDCSGSRLLEVTVSPAADLGEQLVVSGAEKGRPHQLFRRAEGDHFLGAFPTRDVGGHLVTLWMGRVYRISILAEKQGGIAEVLAAASASIPEVLYCTNGDAVVVVTEWGWKLAGDDRHWSPLAATIYRWRGGVYESAERTSWADRASRAMLQCAGLS